MKKLYAVAKADRPLRQQAKDAVRAYRESFGSLVGERVNHRGWPEGVVLTFMQAEVIRPAQDEIQRRLYGKSKGDSQ